MSASLSVWLGGLTVSLVEDPRWMGNQSILHRIKVGNVSAADLIETGGGSISHS